MFAELEAFVSSELTKLAADGRSIEEKLASALHLGKSKATLETINADTTTTTEAKVVAAYAAGTAAATTATPAA